MKIAAALSSSPRSPKSLLKHYDRAPGVERVPAVGLRGQTRTPYKKMKNTIDTYTLFLIKTVDQPLDDWSELTRSVLQVLKERDEFLRPFAQAGTLPSAVGADWMNEEGLAESRLEWEMIKAELEESSTADEEDEKNGKREEKPDFFSLTD